MSCYHKAKSIIDEKSESIGFSIADWDTTNNIFFSKHWPWIRVIMYQMLEVSSLLHQQTYWFTKRLEDMPFDMFVCLVLVDTSGIQTRIQHQDTGSRTCTQQCLTCITIHNPYWRTSPSRGSVSVSRTSKLLDRLQRSLMVVATLIPFYKGGTWIFIGWW